MQLTEQQFLDVLSLAGWPEQLYGEASRIAWSASGLRPAIVNDYGYRGLFQLEWPTWFAEALRQGLVVESERSEWADPVVNAKVALAAYRYLGRWGGTGAWSCAALEGLQ